jgi:hypothetical protein
VGCTASWLVGQSLEGLGRRVLGKKRFRKRVVFQHCVATSVCTHLTTSQGLSPYVKLKNLGQTEPVVVFDEIAAEAKRTCIRGLYDTTNDDVAPLDNSMFKEVPNSMFALQHEGRL